MEFDVFAVRGREEESLYVLPRGERMSGSSTMDGEPVEVIGGVEADTADSAHEIACAEYL